MKRALLLLSVLALAPAVGLPDIFKLAIPTDKGMQFYWWPILPEIPGWRHDEDISRANGVNMLIPVGKTFSNAPAVMYARALFKPRIPETRSLAQLIANDRATFETDVPGTVVSELPAIADGDGKTLRCYSFFPPGKGSWELVAYGEEGEFYLVFTVSGNAKAALNRATTDFSKVVAGYHERL
jgi:hypothetical protein